MYIATYGTLLRLQVITQELRYNIATKQIQLIFSSFEKKIYMVADCDDYLPNENSNYYESYM